MRPDSQAVQVFRYVERQLLNAWIAFRWSAGRRFCADGGERFVESAFLRNGRGFWIPGEQETQQGTERVNIAARVQMFNVSTRLFRGHVARCAHDGAVSRS